MNRLKLIGLIGLPMLVAVSPGPWLALPQEDLRTRRVCQISDWRITECSGMAASAAVPGAIWMHNDSGDGPRAFLVTASGLTRRAVRLQDAGATDWEDMCSFALDGERWLLFGDVGDNPRNRGVRRSAPSLYLVREQDCLSAKSDVPVHRRITFRYEDEPQDCEAIAFDPRGRRVLILTKSLNPFGCGLYEVPLAPDDPERAVARRIASVPIPIATAMDLSADGSRLLIITPRVGFLLNRAANQTWTEALEKPPRAFRLPELRQAESVCFDHTGSRILVTSEGSKQVVFELTP